MKSRISFPEFLKQTLKNQLWVFAFSCLGFFLAAPVFGLMCMNNWRWSSEDIAYSARFLELITSERGMMPFFIWALILAFISAWQGFFYLHSGKQVDFYHAMPIRRETHYIARILSALLNYLVPAGISLLLLVGIAGIRNALSVKGIAALGYIYLSGLCYYLLNYSLGVLSMMLTGTFLVGFLGTMVFGFCGSLLVMVVEGYQEMFYVTRYSMSKDYWVNRASDFSPFLSGIKAAWPGNVSSSPLRAAAAFGIGAAVLLVCTLIYRLRPSESAGKAMAFRKVGQVIKTLLTVLGALTMGFFFLTGMNETRDGWFLFGLVFGVFLIYGLIQLIYCLDIRRVFAEWPFLLVSLLLTLCIAACFRMDVTGYDSYLPKAEEIESIGLSRGDETPNYFGYYYRRVQNGVYYGSLNDRIEYMNLPADDLSYSLLSRMVEETLAIRKKSFYDSPDVWGTEQPFYESVHVKLKNGKDYYRSYRGRLSAVYDLFIELYDCPEFVDAVYITNLFQEEDVINIGVLLEEQILRDEGDGSYSWQYEHRTNLAESREDIRRLKEAVLKDSQSLRPETVKEEVPVGILYMELDSEALMRKQDGTDQEKTAPAEERGETVSSAEASSVSAYYPDGPASMFRNTEESHFPVSFCAYIYSTFTETLQELKKQGILYSTMPEAGQIQEIFVFPAEGKEWSVTAAGSVSPAEGEERPAAATEEIEELYKRFVPDFLNTRWTQARDRAEIRWTDKEGKKRGSSGVLRDIAG